jgi:hypothetical protein
LEIKEINHFSSLIKLNFMFKFLDIKKIVEKDRGYVPIIFLLLLMVLGLIAILIYVCSIWGWNDKMFKDDPTYGYGSTKLAYFLSLLGIGFLIAGGALALGYLTGFIFAIPKPSTSEARATMERYIPNDNLAQISDWLTKIIVGVGLTHLEKIPSYFERLGVYLDPGNYFGRVAVNSIVIYFAISGFLLAYLWTRIYFRTLLERREKQDIVSPAVANLAATELTAEEQLSEDDKEKQNIVSPAVTDLTATKLTAGE